jgi:hypothetical protein
MLHAFFCHPFLLHVPFHRNCCDQLNNSLWSTRTLKEFNTRNVSLETESPSYSHCVQTGGNVITKI